ncbi:MAG: S8 family serine peptidase [Betaproteobacteria bacterium]
MIRLPHRGIALCAFAASLCLVDGIALAADAQIDRLVVKWRDSVARQASPLTFERRNATANALRTGFDTGPTTRDGAVYLMLQPPLPVDAARAALNRLRLDGAVLYANLAPSGAAERAAVGAKAAALSPPTDRLIVKYKAVDATTSASAGDVPSQLQLGRLSALAGTPVSFLRTMHDGAQVMRMLQQLPIAQVEAIAARIAAQPDVEFAQPDYIDRIAAIPTDPCYASAGSSSCGGIFQWDLFEPAGGVNMPPAWDITTGVSNLFVAVVDTGALFNHPDLASRFIGGYDMVISSGVVNSNDGDNRDPDPSDPGDWNTAGQCGAGSAADSSSWHGTHVAGTIGAVANNGIGVTGINWVSRIVPVRVLGRCGGFASDIADGMAWASGAAVAGVPANPNPARVLNVSIGGRRSSQTCDSVYQAAINTALANNAVIAVSAGNSAESASFSTPANCNGVVTVAATGRTGGRASYSNFGTLVEIAAPGGDFALSPPNDFGILSTLNSGATVPAAYIYAEYYGTSMAAPHIAGIASLMLSARPALTPSQVLSKLQTTARTFPTGSGGTDCTTATCGAGIVNAAAAVLSAAGTPSTTTLDASANPAIAGSSVTFTATVTGVAPTGTVRFVDGYGVIAGCAAIPLAGGGNARTAACATSALATGTHPIAAEYSGDATHGASRSATLNQAITSGGSTTTTLASSTNPATAGAQVTFTATVAGTAPTGTVAFTDGGNGVAGCGAVALAGSGNTRQAACATSALVTGVHSIDATYGGDAGNGGSASAPLSQTIVANASTTGLASSSNPAPVGTSITFTATVNGQAPTGGVTFADGALALCSGVVLTGSGNARTAACTTEALSAGAHSISASYAGDTNNNGSASGALTQSVVVTETPRKTRDFSGDAITDILWRDPASGTTTLWLMNGTASTANATLLADPNWTPTHTGFFDADNDADIVWRNAATGETQLWRMNGTGVASTGSLLTSSTWTVTHVADFSGDGKADLLWSNSATGETAMWVMNLYATTASAKLAAPAPWAVTHVADFNGDGTSDLVWRNDATGQTAIWLMSGVNYLSGAVVLADANWRVTHTGDFNGDGKADLVWRNDATGATAIWLMSGTTYLGGAIVLTNTQWRVTHVGDFDGDGKSDLAWRNDTTGETALWLMNGAAYGSGKIMLSDPLKSVVQIGDFNGDGRSDLIVRDASSGQHTVWLMNGLGALATAPLPIGAAFAVIP